jgi:SAM-dependent methyltransferase
MSSHTGTFKKAKETNPSVLRQAMIRRLRRRVTGRGQIVLPAVPALLDHYVQALGSIFSALCRPFNDAELENVRTILRTKLEEGFTASPHAKVTVDYATDPPPSTALTYTISHTVVTIAEEYDGWLESREPPLFGAHADAKVMQLAHSLGTPAEVPVLDIGAGTGRNTLPLLEAGFPTDAIELAPSLAKILREEIAKRNFSGRVVEGDALDPALDVPNNHYRLLVLAEVVASHFRNAGQLRQLFEAAERLLVPGGLLAFSMFLTNGGYKPDRLARELSEALWCCVFTRHELEEAASGLPFARVSDESTYDFELEHLPKEAWPPTGWFSEWARGQDLFDLPADRAPMDLRWLVYKRTE